MNRVIREVSARAFCCPGFSKGGNPVTVFLPSTVKHDSNDSQSSWIPSSKERSLLAKRCEWESVVVAAAKHSGTGASAKVSPRFLFYMPSGEEVSFCAHAAIGASFVYFCNGRQKDDLQWENVERAVNFVCGQENDRPTEYRVCLSGRDQPQLSLQMNVKFEEEGIAGSEEIISELLRQIGLKQDDLDGQSFQNIFNASVARTKTLVPLRSVDCLHSAANPPDPDLFRDLCDSINSSGIYLYTPDESDEARKSIILECRQFSRYSGYPEDPATGIAAAALACHLKMRDEQGKYKDYHVYQGTAMGRRSKISIAFEDSAESNPKKCSSSMDVTLTCTGVVEIISEQSRIL